jgi:hypothetical protein
MNADNEKQMASQSADKKAAKKASTNEIPMVDLSVVLEFVEKIETDGLQTLTAQEVAKGTGYTSATSTPFYRRLVGAKLFGLLDTTQGVNLTKLALDYFKPTDDVAKAMALVTAVKNVVGYKNILERYSGKRVPPKIDIVGNLIEREFNLTTEAAKICASAFMSSVQRAELVQADNTLITTLQQFRPSHLPEAISVKVATQTSPIIPVASSDDSESHYLTLDAKRGRRVVLQAPPVITASELKRIQNWLSVQFHVVDSIEENDMISSENISVDTAATT